MMSAGGFPDVKECKAASCSTVKSKIYKGCEAIAEAYRSNDDYEKYAAFVKKVDVKVTPGDTDGLESQDEFVTECYEKMTAAGALPEFSEAPYKLFYKTAGISADDIEKVNGELAAEEPKKEKKVAKKKAAEEEEEVEEVDEDVDVDEEEEVEEKELTKKEKAKAKKCAKKDKILDEDNACVPCDDGEKANKAGTECVKEEIDVAPFWSRMLRVGYQVVLGYDIEADALGLKGLFSGQPVSKAIWTSDIHLELAPSIPLGDGGGRFMIGVEGDLLVTNVEKAGAKTVTTSDTRESPIVGGGAGFVIGGGYEHENGFNIRAYTAIGWRRFTLENLDLGAALRPESVELDTGYWGLGVALGYKGCIEVAGKFDVLWEPSQKIEGVTTSASASEYRVGIGSKSGAAPVGSVGVMIDPIAIIRELTK